VVEKVIHNKDAKNAQKWSYTRSYTLYPQKNSVFLNGKKDEKQTDVL